MDTAIELFVTNPGVSILLATTIGAISLIVFFVAKDYQSREKQFEQFEARFKASADNIKTYMADLDVTLRSESVRIAKEVRQIEESFFKAQLEIKSESSSIIKQLSQLESTLLSLTSKMQISSETLSERFAVVEKLNRASEESFGKIKILEDGQKEHWKVISKLAEVVVKK